MKEERFDSVPFIKQEIAMGIMMIASFASTIQGFAKGTASTFELILGVIITMLMLITMLILPIIDVKWDN